MSIVNEMKTMRAVAVGKADDIMNAAADGGVTFSNMVDMLLRYAIAGSFLTFQLELLEASQEEVAYKGKGPMPTTGPGAKSSIPPKLEPMEAAAVDAGYINDPRLKDVRADPLYFDKMNGKRACFYFYPQDISEAKEGDIWHDLDGRPHFCLGDGWIEARLFCPKVDKEQRIFAETVDEALSEISFHVRSGQWDRGRVPENQIHKFKLV